ncbi:MAG: hypothetical protein D6798_04245 [Deltaproteobacteria bacterium]|nr:MAG: hypothetical protein D6798_04245 [Deltaproteobacteria bacterium]
MHGKCGSPAPGHPGRLVAGHFPPHRAVPLHPGAIHTDPTLETARTAATISQSRIFTHSGREPGRWTGATPAGSIGGMTPILLMLLPACGQSAPPRGGPDDPAGPAAAEDGGGADDGADSTAENAPGGGDGGTGDTGAAGQPDVPRHDGDVAGPIDVNLVVNGGFEAGSLDGWILVGGDCEVVGGLPDQLPAEGDWMLHGGRDTIADCLLVQDIDLLARGFADADLDQGRFVVQLESWLASTSLPERFDDQARLAVRFLDEAGAELGSLEPLIGTGSEWLERAAEGRLPRGTRTLRVEVEGRLRRGTDNDSIADDIQVRLQPAGRSSPVITKAPLLQDHRRDAMRILWETDGNLASSLVRWDVPGGGLRHRATRVRTIQVDPTRFVHVADIEGLFPGTLYEYAVSTGDTRSDRYLFRTTPEPDAGAVTIAWMADNQDGPEVMATHIRHMHARSPDLLIAPGDVIEHADVASEWSDYWWAPLTEDDFGQTTPVLIARGNHDAEHPYAYAYTALPGNEAWYSFRYGPVFVVVLDSGGPKSDPDLATDQARFIEEALASDEARTATFRIVVMHAAPYTNTNKGDGSDGDADARAAWERRFVDGDVDLVVAGHYHSYQRGEHDGIVYTVVGGGGAVLDGETHDNWDWLRVVDVTFHYSLMEVRGDRLQWTTYDLDDEVIDRFTIQADR